MRSAYEGWSQLAAHPLPDGHLQVLAGVHTHARCRLYRTCRLHHLYRRIHACLRHGLYCAGRTYHFMAFSASQLRQGGAWVLAAPRPEAGDVGSGNIDEVNQARSRQRCAAGGGECVCGGG